VTGRHKISYLRHLISAWLDDWSIIGSNATTARHLLEKGANPNIQTAKDGTNPLESAVPVESGK
jgi:hypothetical protein